MLVHDLQCLAKLNCLPSNMLHTLCYVIDMQLYIYTIYDDDDADDADADADDDDYF